MQEITLPKNVNYQKTDQENAGIISIEPCFPGYGTTLGNSLRRVLLSSLSGAAVIGVKIEGADHEFMALPHVKEDVLDIILNLKQLRVKMHTDEEVKLELNVTGEKIVKAGDIIKNSEVEIVNPDLVIANISDISGKLKMEITVSKGLGYRTVEQIKDKKREIGYIDMDSIFSPVLSVGLNVEDVRVGKMTNWEKLTLNIVTDGTISPKEAYEKSVEILINQFGSLVGKEYNEVMNEIEEKKKRKEQEEKALQARIEEVEELQKEEAKLEKKDEEDKEESKEEAEPKKKRGRPRKEDK